MLLKTTLMNMLNWQPMLMHDLYLFSGAQTGLEGFQSKWIHWCLASGCSVNVNTNYLDFCIETGKTFSRRQTKLSNPYLFGFFFLLQDVSHCSRYFPQGKNKTFCLWFLRVFVFKHKSTPTSERGSAMLAGPLTMSHECRTMLKVK